MADNIVLKISGEELPRLKIAMNLSSQQKAKGYAVHPDKGIVFFWADHKDMIPFPTPLDMDRCAEIAYAWLIEEADYGRQPDHDGDNERGWLLYCDGWGHIDLYGWKAFVAVKPMWLMFGK